nr:MAG TPA: hypothetical protein [Caudoviricetes sp.]
MILGVNLVWRETLDLLIKEGFLYDGDKVLCVDADGIVRRLTWNEADNALTNAKGVIFEETDFVEFCNDCAL